MKSMTLMMALCLTAIFTSSCQNIAGRNGSKTVIKVDNAIGEKQLKLEPEDDPELKRLTGQLENINFKKYVLIDAIIVPGDTLGDIASDYQSGVALIKKANPNIKGNADLKSGMIIKIPRKKR